MKKNEIETTKKQGDKKANNTLLLKKRVEIAKDSRKNNLGWRRII